MTTARLNNADSNTEAGSETVEEQVIHIRRGQTVTATLILDRKLGFDKEVNFGKEFAARNAAHGVYVDNIGLNGLLIRAGESEREFFLTADPIAQLGPRQMFLTAEIDGGVTTQCVTVEVLAEE